MSGYLGLGGGGGTQKQIVYSGLQVSSSRIDLPVPIFWGQRRLSRNALWYNDFQKHAQSAKGKGGGGKGGKMYTYTAATITALCEGPLDSSGILNVWTSGSSTTTTTLSKLNMTLFLGTAVQAPWSFVTTKYPTQARAYALTAYLACPKEDLGSSAQIPDNGYEAARTLAFAYTLTSNGYKNPSTGVVTSAVDVLLSDCLNDWLTSAQYGMGFAVGDLTGPIGDQTQWATYMRAQGLFFSPYLHTQEKATAVIDRWAQLTNSWIYWAGTQFVYVPLGDSVVTGNGVTYTPDLTAAYDLDTTHFIDKETPVKVQRADPADCYNRTTLSFVDRTVGYTTNSVEYKDQTLIDQYGLRDASTVNGDEVCNPAVAQNIVELLGKRAAYLRNTYQFKLSYRFIRLLPGSIVTLTEPNIGLSKVRVRVKTVSEDDNENLDVMAEELPGLIGTVGGSPATGPNPLPSPNNPNQMADPGNVNTPAIVEPNSNFTGGQAVIVIAASGGANWGGANVHISFDGVNYSRIGTITSPAPQGTLTAILASHADPDTTNTLAVDCTQSQTVPAAGITTADADANRTLSLVVGQPSLVAGAYVFPTGELLSFGTVTTTGTYTANLTYLRRGQYGSAPAAHAIGDQFTVVDVLGTSGTAVRYSLPAQYIGQPVYIKLTSFNLFDNAEQDISVVNEYEYVPTGTGYGGGTGPSGTTPGVPTVPGTPSVSVGSGQNVVSWASNPSTDNVTKYTLYAGSGIGTPFGSCVAIWNGLATSYAHTGLTTGAQFTYYVVATNAVGPSAPSAAGSGSQGTFTYALRAMGGTPGRKPNGGSPNGEELFNATMKTGDSLPAGLTGSLLRCEVAPTVNWTVTLYRNGVSIGTGTINAGATTGTWTFASTVTFADGDAWTANAPATQDATCSGVSYTILGTRTQ
jgi:hypothetical protein